MKKNLIKLSAVMLVAIIMTGIVVVSASSNYVGPVTLTTPAWGQNPAQNKTIHDGKTTNSSTGTVYTTAESTVLKHSISLTYINYTGNTWVQGSDWVTSQKDVIKRPSLWLSTWGTSFFSQAKSNNYEPTNNTTVTFKFSADQL